MFGSLARPSAALLVALCAVAGCMNVDLAKSYPERRYYLLDAERQGPPAPVHFERNVTVHKCSVSPAFDGRELVYRLSDAGYASDFENQLFVTPGYAIAEEVRKWLAKSQVFANVVASRSELESDYVVEPNLVELYGDYRDETAPKAVLELQLYLIDDRQRPSEVLLKTDFRDERPLADSSAAALVEGWSASLRAALERFEEALQGLKPAEP
jgi:ABC-type uncharacterized transport system auxiliary subunit